MDIKELRKSRQKLEIDIASSVSALVEKFKNETGFSPYRIHINMVDQKEFGHYEPQYLVKSCEIDIEL